MVSALFVGLLGLIASCNAKISYTVTYKTTIKAADLGLYAVVNPSLMLSSNSRQILVNSQITASVKAQLEKDIIFVGRRRGTGGSIGEVFYEEDDSGNVDIVPQLIGDERPIEGPLNISIPFSIGNITRNINVTQIIVTPMNDDDNTNLTIILSVLFSIFGLFIVILSTWWIMHMKKKKVTSEAHITSPYTVFDNFFTGHANDPINQAPVYVPEYASGDNNDQSSVSTNSIEMKPSKKVLTLGTAAQQSCIRCKKAMYIADQPLSITMMVNKQLQQFHAGCFSCSTCSTKLSLATVYQAQGQVYCAHHNPESGFLLNY